MWKEYSQSSAKSRGFSSGFLVSSHRKSWQGGLGNMSWMATCKNEEYSIVIGVTLFK